MSSKFRAFFGLNDGDNAVETNRKRRNDYMKKFKRLVVPEDDEAEAGPAPENIVTAPQAEDEVQPAAAEAAAPEAEQPAAEAETSEAPAELEQPTPRNFRHSASEKEGKKSFASRFLRVGESLRRPSEGGKALILVKSGALEMIEDIEDALVKGQSVLLDFEREDRSAMVTVATKLVNFVRLHKGAFYAVTRTSMLLTLSSDAVVEWRPGGEE